MKLTIEVKDPKSRITLGLCANASGSFKLPLIVIHKAAKPICFGRNFNMNSLPVHYRKQSKAWMDQQIFEEWFHRKFVPAVEDYLESIGSEKKALLLIDNCPAHPLDLVSTSGLITTKFLPPNTTSLIQPMDQSPIAVLKKAYRTHLLREYLLKYDNIPYSEFIKSMLLKYIYFDYSGY